MQSLSAKRQIAHFILFSLNIEITMGKCIGKRVEKGIFSEANIGTGVVTDSADLLACI